MASDAITFGPVHLGITNVERALAFWVEILGLQLRNQKTDPVLELGTEQDTLVVLRPDATHPARPGYGGLYHLAIHLPAEAEFARVLARLLVYRYPIGPTDHIMSKAIYLDDPDGIGVELTLETPERVKVWGMDANGYPQVIDAQGIERSGREALDLEEVLAKLPDDNLRLPMPVGTKIGHMHLHVGDLAAANGFYKQLGFTENMFSTKVGMADLHAGGSFPHRLALNTWQGEGVVQPPAGTAGLRWFMLAYRDAVLLEQVVQSLAGVRKDEAGYWIEDPAGNQLLLTRA